MKSLLFLSTKKSNRPETPYQTDWQINLPRFNNETYTARLIECTGDNVVPNINSNNNTVEIAITVLGNLEGTTTLTLQPNQYDSESLSIALKEGIDAAITEVGGNSATLTVTIDEVTSILQIVGDNNASIDIVGGTMLPLLGITNPSSGLSENYVVTGDSAVNLLGSLFIDLNFSFSSNNVAPGQPNSHIFARVPVDCNYGEQFTYIPYYNYGEKIETQLDDIFLTITDEDGNLWPYPSNHNLNVAIELTTVGGRDLIHAANPL